MSDSRSPPVLVEVVFVGRSRDERIVRLCMDEARAVYQGPGHVESCTVRLSRHATGGTEIQIDILAEEGNVLVDRYSPPSSAERVPAVLRQSFDRVARRLADVCARSSSEEAVTAEPEPTQPPCTWYG